MSTAVTYVLHNRSKSRDFKFTIVDHTQTILDDNCIYLNYQWDGITCSIQLLGDNKHESYIEVKNEFLYRVMQALDFTDEIYLSLYAGEKRSEISKLYHRAMDHIFVRPTDAFATMEILLS